MLIALITLFLIHDHSLSSPVLVATLYHLRFLQEIDVMITKSKS